MVRKRILVGAAVSATVLAAALVSGAGSAGAGGAGTSKVAAPSGAGEYLVVMTAGQRTGALAAIKRAGGTVVRENTEIGTALVRTSQASFAASVAGSAAVSGVARNTVIGWTTRGSKAASDRFQELVTGATAKAMAKARSGRDVRAEPLAELQWDMRMIGATPDGSYSRETGDRGVRVGIMDTGIDGTHPDLRRNFSNALSRNFTTDVPEAGGVEIDGPCEVPSCKDPANVDDNGHGTHVAGTVAAGINELGVAGVAPNVTLVNIRAGQDSGFFFLQSTLDAFVYAGKAGIDVVNMSFFTDPWLFNCRANPADSPAEQAEQTAVIEATQRAVNFARSRGVTLVAALGNEATDLGQPELDTTSPDFPPGNEKERAVDNSCITVPTETRGVISVSSLGPSKRKSYFSNYGTEQTDLSAPGGDVYDSPDQRRHLENAVLSSYPESVLRTDGLLEPDGTPLPGFGVIRDCRGGTCAYYRYLQGTSMASPHAAGVAALVVSRFGHRDRARGGLTLDPRVTEAILTETAVETPCPTPRTFHYRRIVVVNGVDTIVEADHTCEGPTEKNGFYGSGIVNADNVARAR